MDVVFCSDDNYVMHCGIAMISMLENNKNADIVTHIVGKGISDENKAVLKGISDKYNAQIKFYNISDEELSKYPLPPTPLHINVSAYIRLFLFDILPQEIEKVLYLDCDLVVVDDLSDLWNINIDNYSVAGVIDSNEYTDADYLARKFDPLKSYTYINSGVMLMNLKYWREHNVLDKLIAYIRDNYESIHYADQDTLNGALPDSIGFLPFRYNVHLTFFTNKFRVLDAFQKEIDAALHDIAIIHYTTSMKPWLKGCVHPLKDTFLKYKAMSPWKDVPITWGNQPGSKKRRYYKRLILGKLGFKKYKSVKFD